MQRGEVWWVEFDELRPVVLLSGDETSGFQTMQIVPPSGVDISGLGIEVSIGAIDGLSYEGVVWLGFPNPDFLFCTWLTTVTSESLIERAGVLPLAKLSEIDEALRVSAREPEWTPQRVRQAQRDQGCTPPRRPPDAQQELSVLNGSRA